jgi:hypothetical protein
MSHFSRLRVVSLFFFDANVQPYTNFTRRNGHVPEDGHLARGNLKTAMDRTQTGGAGTKAKAKIGEVLTTEGTEGTEENQNAFLCVLCALCGLAILMLPSFLSAAISPDGTERLNLSSTEPQRTRAEKELNSFLTITPKCCAVST